MEKLTALLAAITALIPLIGSLTGATEVARRNDPTISWFAIVLGAVGLVSTALLWLWGPAGATRRVISFFAVVGLSLSILLFVLVLSRSGTTDTRPVVTVGVTGSTTITMAGKATASGLSADGALAMFALDGDHPVFSGVVGADGETGVAELAYSFNVAPLPARDITIVAWVPSRAPLPAELFGHDYTVGKCDDAPRPSGDMPPLADLPRVSCLTVHIPSVSSSGPRLSLAPAVSKDGRSVTIAVDAVIQPSETILVAVWDGSNLIYQSLLRPTADGSIKSSTLLPIGDQEADICATADVTSGVGAVPATAPDPCKGTASISTFSQVVIPRAPTPAPTASPTPTASPSGS